MVRFVLSRTAMDSRAFILLAMSVTACEPPPRPADDTRAWKDAEVAAERADLLACASGPLEACAASCARGRAASCRQLGERVCKEGSLLECRATCEGGNAFACEALGHEYFQGRGGPEQKGQGYVFLDLACAKGRRHACEELGDYYLGAEMSVDPVNHKRRVAYQSRAIRYFERGCNFDKLDGNARDSGAGACYKLGLYAPEQALPRMDRSCLEGSIVACTYLALNKDASKPMLLHSLQRLCASPPRSAYCGRLKDVAVEIGVVE